jgi:hypothetical protein
MIVTPHKAKDATEHPCCSPVLFYKSPSAGHRSRTAAAAAAAIQTYGRIAAAYTALQQVMLYTLQQQIIAATASAVSLSAYTTSIESWCAGVAAHTS